jgi:DNA-binding NarL/FixJ family response regulator
VTDQIHVLTTFDQGDHVIDGIRRGAAGFLPKNAAG